MRERHKSVQLRPPLPCGPQCTFQVQTSMHASSPKLLRAHDVRDGRQLALHDLQAHSQKLEGALCVCGDMEG